jgi:hypothetical protein
MQMNEVRHPASGGVQRAVTKVISMISDPGQPAGHRDPLKEETTMLKTISAALVAVSVLAAPALAAAPGKTTQTTTIKAPVTKTVKAPVIKASASKSKFLNANASMGRHHHKHYRHHSDHKHMGVLKTHAAPKLAVKHVTPSPRRG